MDEKYRKRCFNCRKFRKVKHAGKVCVEHYECNDDGSVIGYVDALKKTCDAWEPKEDGLN